MNLEEQIASMLNDPETMSKLTAIASALGGQAPSQPSPPTPSPPAAASAQSENPASQSGLRLPDMSGDNRTRLLMAIKPFLSEKRAPYVDGAVALLRMMQLGKLGKDMKLF